MVLVLLPLFLAQPARPGAPPPGPLTTASAVRSLTPDEAARGFPAVVTGVVTLANPATPNLFLQDDTSGLFVLADVLPAGLQPGVRVRVTGKTRSGWFSPVVAAERIEPLGAAPLPAPLPFGFSLTEARWLDGQLVQTYCLVREVRAAPGNAQLVVEGTAGPGALWFREPARAADLAPRVGAVVRVRGVCVPEFDADGRVTGHVRVFLQSERDVVVVEPPDHLATAPLRTAEYLRRFLPGVSPIQLVRMSGVVTGRPDAGALLVQDETGGFTVQLRAGAAPPPGPGTRVEVTGFFTLSAGRVAVRGADVSPRGAGGLPDPRDIRSLADVAAADGCRARFQGRVTEAGGDRLTLAAGGMAVTVRLPPAAGPAAEVGSLVTATGALAGPAAESIGVVLFPLTPDDVVVDETPDRPWVTRSEAAGAVAAGAALLLAAVAWGMALRRAVRQRTLQFRESERKFATMFHADPDAVVLTRTTDGEFLEVNDGFCRLTGYHRDQVLGRSTVEMTWFDPDHRVRLLAAVRAGGTVRDYPATVRDVTGQPREVLISATFVAVGGVDCLLSILRDVTDQRRAERAARTERQFTDVMTESLPGILYVYDAGGRFLRWNRNFETATGYAAAEIARMRPLDFFAGAEKALLARRIGEVFDTGQGFVEASLVAKDGTATPYFFTGRRTEFEGATCLVGIGLDASAAREAERRLAESERRYRELVELANSIILRWDPEGRITLLNEFGQRFFGYSAAEIVGRHVMETIVPATESSGRDLDTLMKQVLANPTAFEQSVNENVKRNGERVWVSWTNRIVYDNERIVEILSIGSDITERRRMEQTLAASEKKFAAVFRLSPVSLALSQMDGTVLDVNQAFEKLYQVARGQIVGRPATDFRQLYDSPEERAGYARRLLRDGRIRDVETRRVLADGSAVDTVTSAELIDLDGVPHALVAATDVTPLKRAKAALREANALLEQRVAERTTELAAANTELEAFCYSVSHDLRAPLRSIDGFSQAVLEDYADRLDADGTDFLRRIRAAAGRMGELIDDLLNLSRVSRVDMHREPVDLSALAAEVVAALREADPGRRVEVSIAPGLTAHADRNLVRVLLENLLGNAWKYTAKTADPRIELGSVAGGGPAGFYVRDNGAGFDPKYAAKLFQPFQRLHRSDEFPGHGVGLATVLRIVRRHGGAVAADASPGRGATFRFTLPQLDTDHKTPLP